MLAELHIESLGVIERLTLPFGPGLTVVTGETGAGKTMLVEAVDLLLGGRADTSVVRHGAAEARIEGRFVIGADEHVVTRIVPVDGRSRAYLDGRPITATTLTEAVSGWIELHGQHSHQRLATTADQRAALDAWAGTDLAPLAAIHTQLAEVAAAIGALGGDPRTRERHADLLHYQLTELDGALLTDPDEDRALSDEHDVLSQADQLRIAADEAAAALRGDGGAADSVGVARQALGHAPPFADALARLQAVAAELDDVADDLRRAGETIVADPERMEQIRLRRQLLRDLCRKYGDTLADVIDYRRQIAGELDELRSHDQRVADLERRRSELREAELAAAAVVRTTRHQAAPGLAAELQHRLSALAMPDAVVRLAVAAADDDAAGAGDDVEILMSANPGLPPAPLAKAASGGELSRTMLALRVVLSADASTMVFDEVDAGIGGQTAIAVAEALSELAAHRQVLVVTHLAQVAALADHHVVVTKSVSRDDHQASTVTSACYVADAARIAEVARLLSGNADSPKARAHAGELLAAGRR